MSTYVVEYIYAKLKDDYITVEADSPEEAEQKAIEELEDKGLRENCYLERYRALSNDYEDIEPEREYVELNEPTIEVEIDGLLTVVNKPRGTHLVIIGPGRSPITFNSDTRIVDRMFEVEPV